jgi:hypothetical protein
MGFKHCGKVGSPDFVPCFAGVFQTCHHFLPDHGSFQLGHSSDDREHGFFHHSFVRMTVKTSQNSTSHSKTCDKLRRVYSVSGTDTLPAHFGEQHDAGGPHQVGIRQTGRVVAHHLDLEGCVVLVRVVGNVVHRATQQRLID